MNKHIYDETTNISYSMQGQYYLPDLSLSEEEHPIGIWGQRYLRYLKQHRNRKIIIICIPFFTYVSDNKF